MPVEADYPNLTGSILLVLFRWDFRSSPALLKATLDQFATDNQFERLPFAHFRGSNTVIDIKFKRSVIHRMIYWRCSDCLIDKIRRALSLRHIGDGEFGQRIADHQRYRA